jgi:alpha-beta hydrolase superfamily lysophospholipase
MLHQWKRYTLVPLIAIFSHSSAAAGRDFQDCQKPWSSLSKTSNCEPVPFEAQVTYPYSVLLNPIFSFGNFSVDASVRARFLVENINVPFRGNILYFEGLGDSIQNHAPLFNRLTAEGFRVIAFDYMGQGGSEGEMNDTRIWDIPRVGLQVLSRYGRDLPLFPKPIILGWSTGGLAGYLAAQQQVAAAVILIAPGISPNFIVGEQHLLHFQVDRITQRTLTTAKYDLQHPNPHVDVIAPNSPLAVPDFALSLQIAAAESKNWNINPSIPGFVLLSGAKDTYVNASDTMKVIRKHAAHFKIEMYAAALHEIDNEASVTQIKMQSDILNFLKGIRDGNK